jgi:hypothetical protein
MKRGMGGVYVKTTVEVTMKPMGSVRGKDLAHMKIWGWYEPSSAAREATLRLVEHLDQRGVPMPMVVGSLFAGAHCEWEDRDGAVIVGVDQDGVYSIITSSFGEEDYTQLHEATLEQATEALKRFIVQQP